MAVLSQDGSFVTVEQGDTLYNIAVTHGTAVSDLAHINHIKNANLISIGQKIFLSYAEAPAQVVDNANRATILQFGLLSTSGNTLFATWEWKATDTGSYYVKWEYIPKDWPDTWLSGSSTSISVKEEDPDQAKQSTYTIPENAISVRFTVKPMPKTASSSGGVIYNSGTSSSTSWAADWSTVKRYDVGSSPITPPVPSIEINDAGLLLTTLENLNVNATAIHFQVVKREGTRFITVGGSDYKGTTIQFVDADTNGTIDDSERVNGYARYSCYVNDGGEYKVRARSSNGSVFSPWSAYSSTVYTKPEGTQIAAIRASSKTSVYLEWFTVETATSYDIQYSTDSKFDVSDQQVSSDSTDHTKRTFTGLATGDEYFFRVRAVNSGGESDWSDVVSVVLGSTPAAPTTWSSSTTVTTGGALTLYWVHNSKDGSREKSAELELIIGDIKKTIEIQNTATEEDEVTTSFYDNVDTSLYSQGTVIKWRVRTKGITDTYGEFSVQRTVDVYANPTLALSVTDASGESTDTVTALPLKVYANGGPSTQSPIGYHLSVTADSAYETVDNVGNEKSVGANEEIYSKYFDVSGALYTELSAGDISLENNITYTVTCTVTMNSGLTAVQSSKFTVAWSYDNYWPNAEVIINDRAYTATIRPYCRDASETLVDGVTLAVYRRDYNGTFTKLIDGVSNDGGTYIVDPHPALDYARYRIVATSISTGAISYYDMPGREVGCDAAVIQWDETWSNFDIPSTNVPVEPSWSGSFVKLPYNIDVSESNSHDVALIKYAGRSHPVSYYGTHIGESGSWSMVIDKNDKDTLYALRRLGRWMGNVYVREPSGVGYWASVTVSISQKHRELTVPVTLEITRVEGGI